MTLLDILISEAVETEKAVKQAVNERKLSARAGNVLFDESIKVLVALQGQEMLRQKYEAAQHEARIAVATPGLKVVPN